MTKTMKAQLDEQIDDYCREFKIPGMALMVYQDGESIYENYSGFRNVREKSPVNKDTVFGLASITKPLTACTVMKLTSEGKLSVTDKVKDWLPDLQWPDQAAFEILTIKHLMSHTSGLPGLPAIHNARLRSIMSDPDGEFLFGRPVTGASLIDTADELIEQLNTLEFELLGAPGEVFNYSNEGYGLLQKIIENAAGKSFPDYVHDNIFIPLKMDRSSFLTSSVQEKENTAELYAYEEDKKDVFHSPEWWDVGEIYTNGSWKASARDVMTFAEMLRLKEPDSLSEGIRQMTSSFTSLPNGGDYGFGIEINDTGGYKRFGHGGSIKGVSSNFQVIRDEKISAVLLINMADVPAEKILVNVLNIILRISETSPFSDDGIKNNVDLSDLTGIYHSDEGYRVPVLSDDGVLMLDRGAEVTAFYPLSEQDFVSKTGERIYFRRKDSKVVSVLLGKRVLVKQK